MQTTYHFRIMIRYYCACQGNGNTAEKWIKIIQDIQVHKSAIKLFGPIDTGTYPIYITQLTFKRPEILTNIVLRADYVFLAVPVVGILIVGLIEVSLTTNWSSLKIFRNPASFPGLVLSS